MKTLPVRYFPVSTASAGPSTTINTATTPASAVGQAQEALLAFVASLFFLACLLPYFSPMPVAGMDVQPVAFVLGLIGSIVLATTSGTVRIARSDLLFLVLACVFMFYFNPSDPHFAILDLRKTVSMAIGFFIYVAARNLLSYFSFQILEIAAFVALGFQFLQSRLPAVYVALSEHLLPRAFTTASRGFGGAFPEAAFAGYFAVLYLILYTLLLYRGDSIPRWRSWLFIGVCIAIMVISLSVTALSIGTLMGLVALSMTNRRRWFLLLLALTIGGILFIIAIAPILPSSFRVVQLIQNAIQDPRLLLSDESVVNRLNSVLLGFTFPFQFPLGAGILFPDKDFLLSMPGYVELSNAIFNPRALDFLFEVYPVSLLMNDFAVLMFRMGWLGLLASVIFLALFRGHRFSRLVQAFVVITTLGSFPLSLPPVYLLMAWVRAGQRKLAAPPAPEPSPHSWMQ